MRSNQFDRSAPPIARSTASTCSSRLGRSSSWATRPPLNTVAAAAVLSLAFGGGADASSAKRAGAEGVDWIEGGVLTYEVFEFSVDHVDLENCPAGLDPEAVFCRMTLAAEQANVWIFDQTGDQPLLAVKHYPLDENFLPF